MTENLRFRRQAVLELHRAIDWYNGERPEGPSKNKRASWPRRRPASACSETAVVSGYFKVPEWALAGMDPPARWCGCSWMDPDLGTAFVLAFDQTMEVISDNPRLGTAFGGSFRRVPVRSFPYVVVYRPDPDGITVLAIWHGKRDPADLLRELRRRR